MIPKQIFFIWFGDNKPEYIEYVIKNFKDVNPDFKIDFVWYKIEDINNAKDPILKKCIDMSFYNIDNTYLRWTLYSHPRFGYTLRFQEFYRFELIKKYGGIYLDCDTFPIRPFDDELLNNESFCAHTFWSEDFKERKPDISFFGYKKDYNIVDYYSFKKTIDIVPFNYNTNSKWLECRKKFYNLELKVGETADNQYYIDHYFKKSWVNNNIPKCKFDEH